MILDYLNDPRVLEIVEHSRLNSFTRRQLQNALEDLEELSEDEIDDILDWYREYYV